MAKQNNYINDYDNSVSLDDIEAVEGDINKGLIKKVPVTEIEDAHEKTIYDDGRSKILHMVPRGRDHSYIVTECPQNNTAAHRVERKGNLESAIKVQTHSIMMANSQP